MYLTLWRKLWKRIANIAVRSEPLYHYTIIRSDLPLGTQLAQTIHAAGESSPGNLPPATRAVALHIGSESELLELERALQEAGIPHNAIREPDAPWNGQLMAIGIRPMVKGSLIKAILGKYRLAK